MHPEVLTLEFQRLLFTGSNTVSLSTIKKLVVKNSATYDHLVGRTFLVDMQGTEMACEYLRSFPSSTMNDTLCMNEPLGKE